jgi:hypothetical protein
MEALQTGLISARKGARWFLITLIASALAIGWADIVLIFRDVEPSPRALQLWSFAYAWIAVLWIDLDSRGRENIQKPFDYLFLIFYFLPFYLAYYLIRTRRSWGVLGFIGFGILFIFSTFPIFLSE